jgi:hypothetical protein
VPRDLRRFIEMSLSALKQEAPAFYVRLCDGLDGRTVDIRGDGEPFALSFCQSAARSGPAHGAADVRLAVDRSTILALVDGEVSLEDALEQDRLYVRGNLQHVLQVFEGLVTFVRGAIRCPSSPQLLADFRSSDPGRFQECSP